MSGENSRLRRKIRRIMAWVFTSITDKIICCIWCLFMRHDLWDPLWCVSRCEPWNSWMFLRCKRNDPSIVISRGYTLTYWTILVWEPRKASWKRIYQLLFYFFQLIESVTQMSNRIPMVRWNERQLIGSGNRGFNEGRADRRRCVSASAECRGHVPSKTSFQAPL